MVKYYGMSNPSHYRFALNRSTQFFRGYRIIIRNVYVYQKQISLNATLDELIFSSWTRWPIVAPPTSPPRSSPNHHAIC